MSNKSKKNFKNYTANYKKNKDNGTLSQPVINSINTKTDIEDKGVDLVSEKQALDSIQLDPEKLSSRFNKKTTNKANGVKSILYNNNDIVMTSVFKDAEKDGSYIELECSSKDKKITKESKRYTLDFEGDNFNVIHAGETSNKSYMINDLLNDDEVGMDYMRVKDVVETNIFGERFPNNNIMIQIAYNVLDIKKILAPYISLIVNTMYNFGCKAKGTIDDEYDENMDFIGRLPYETSFDDYKKEKAKDAYIIPYIQSISPYMSCFGKVFQLPDSLKEEYQNKYGKDNMYSAYKYNLFRLLSMARQFCEHSNNKNEIVLYKLSSNNYLELKNILKKHFDESVEKINSAFAENAHYNIKCLFKVFDCYSKDKEKKLIKDYYEFDVRKYNHNMGISLVKLRECALQNNYPDLLSDKYSDCRSKMFKLINFVLYKYLTEENSELLEEMVAMLRKLPTKNQLEKDKLYDRYSKIIWCDVKDRVDTIVLLMNDLMDNGLKEKEDKEFTKRIQDIINSGNYNNSLKDIVLTDKTPENDAILFCYIIYYLSTFIDKKEVNNIITSMISKFDNIADLLGVVEELGINYKFTNNYTMFDFSRLISNNMRIINSFGTIKIADVIPNKILYRDALELLGLSYKYERNLDEIIEEIDDKNNDNYKSLRNFIKNHVIKSARFFYVLKYSDPKKCRLMMKNYSLVRMALEKLPENQIVRCYNAVEDNKNDVTLKNKIDCLVKKMNKYSCEEIEKIILLDSKKQAKERKELISIMDLYLLVAYHITKNIVNINTTYMIACGIIERDYAFYRDKQIIRRNDDILKGYDFSLADEKTKIKNPIALTEYFINHVSKNKHAIEYLKNNLKEYKDLFGDSNYAWNKYRNNIAHDNISKAISKYMFNDEKQDMYTRMNSYFDLYQYVMQKLIFKDVKGLDSYENKVMKYNNYSKDLVKILNMPFAYNLARYKKISVADLFNEIQEEDDK